MKIDIKKLPPNFTLDLRGIECPLNYVKTKIQIDKMKKDEILEVVLDSGEPFDSVKNSLEIDGYEILFFTQVDNFFNLFVKC